MTFYRSRTFGLLRTSNLCAVMLAFSAVLHAQEGKPQKQEPSSALDRALKELPEDPPAQSREPDSPFRLLDISADMLFAVGGSTERDESLRNLQGGGHDPRKRGFNVQAIELSMIGAIDPYFRGETHLVYFIDEEGESRFELEEAFLQTTSLPHGFGVEAGMFFTEFGRINPQHAHQWQWLDQPVIHSRLFGADGMRGPGVRASWLAPTQWFSEFHAGVQNSGGETMASFNGSDELAEERPIGGRPWVESETSSMSDLVYLVRWVNATDLGENTEASLGLSGLFGPNSSGSDGNTRIYGADLVLKWTDPNSHRGAPFFAWESEFLYRDYRADGFLSDGGTSNPADDINVASTSLDDYGLYTQIVYGVTDRWRAGLRYEFASGDGQNWDEDNRTLSDRGTDPFRDDRQRVSPLVSWHLSEYSRLRLQYNYDMADHLPSGDAHTVWLGVEVLLGSHPAHKF